MGGALGWHLRGEAGSSLTASPTITTSNIFPAGSEDEEEVTATSTRRTVFSRALQAGELHWNDSHLQRILASDSCGPSLTANMGGDKPTLDPQGHPVWLGEPFPTACARVDTLRAHGYPHKALRLACAIINTLRLQRRHQLESYKQQKKGKWGHRPKARTGHEREQRAATPALTLSVAGRKDVSISEYCWLNLEHCGGRTQWVRCSSVGEECCRA